MAPAVHKECWKLPLQTDKDLDNEVSSESERQASSQEAWTITSNRASTKSDDELYWWRSCGYALATLLQTAKYEQKNQAAILQFFSDHIIPHLGSSPTHSLQWKSFMTDDHAPIELSWEWHPSKQNPVIRFSIEPVAVNAGSNDDPDNTLAASRFRESMVKSFPMNMEWYDHFEKNMNRPELDRHPSKIFWAFDLEEESPTAKAYFFPTQNRIDLFSEVIAAAPDCTAENLIAWEVFRSFIQESEADLFMISIDLLDLQESRIKMYFRDSRTSFSSVTENMTLGNRITDHDTDRGLQQIRKLWDALFEQSHLPHTSSLPRVDHPTAGILYLAEFRLGDQLPKTKIYLPVRHYASNDFHVMNVLRDQAFNQDYVDAMTTIFKETELKQGRGVHTYVGCSILPEGALRVVSYINCQQAKMQTVR